MKKISMLLFVLFCINLQAFAMSEGTRHIYGKNADLYFMNDKVFGTVNNKPVWAIYTCGTAIKGEIDINGNYKKFAFKYSVDGNSNISGTFDSVKMSLGNIERKDEKLIYNVVIGGKKHIFSIKYERIENKHMINSIIEGYFTGGDKIKLTVDGQLCPFATTGIILIVSGSLLSGQYQSE